MAMRMTTIMIGTAYRGPVVFIYPGPRRMSLPRAPSYFSAHAGSRRMSLPRAPSYVSTQKVSPQNGGFIRAKLTRPRIFCYKNNVRNIQHGGFIRAKSGPLIRHQARILYLLILWSLPRAPSYVSTQGPVVCLYPCRAPSYFSTHAGPHKLTLKTMTVEASFPVIAKTGSRRAASTCI